MTTLLIESHLAHALAEALVRRGVDAVHASRWQGGSWRTVDDETLLGVATLAQRVLVSRDIATLPAIAYRWVAEGRRHAGLLIVSSRIDQQDVGAHLAAIMAAIAEHGDQPWENAVVYAQRPR